MPTFDELLSHLPEVDPLILIVGVVIAVILVLILFRFAAGLAVRLLSIGCVIIVIAGIIWFLIQFVF